MQQCADVPSCCGEGLIAPKTLSHAGAASSRCSSALFIFYSLGTIIKTPAAIPLHGVNRVYRGPLV